MVRIGKCPWLCEIDILTSSNFREGSCLVGGWFVAIFVSMLLFLELKEVFSLRMCADLVLSDLAAKFGVLRGKMNPRLNEYKVLWNLGTLRLCCLPIPNDEIPLGHQRQHLHICRNDNSTAGIIIFCRASAKLKA